MEDIHLPLVKFFYDFFLRLSERERSLGMDEYFLLVKLLQAGFGLESKEKLLQLCKTIWFKPYMEEEEFTSQFEKYWQEERKEFSELKKKLIEPSQNKSQEDETSKEEIPDRANFTKPIPSSEPEKEELEDEPDKESNTETEVYLSIEHRKKSGDEHSISLEKLEITEKYDFFENYFPIQERRIMQGFRYIQKKEEAEDSDEINIPEIIKQYTEKLFIEKLVYHKVLENKERILLLVDNSRSMIAFKKFHENLIACIETAGLKVEPIYFQNIPEEIVYEDYYNNKPIEFDSILRRYKRKPCPVIVFSDAGAARMTLNRERDYFTDFFIDKIKQITSRLVWINPVQERRWKERTDSTAGLISKKFPMEEYSTSGMGKAILRLRRRVSF